MFSALVHKSSVKGFLTGPQTTVLNISPYATVPQILEV